MLKIRITSWSGFTEAPVVVGETESQDDQPQPDARPKLRLIVSNER